MKKVALVLMSMFAAPALADPPAGYILTFDEEFSTLSVSDATTNDGSRWYTQTKICCMQPTDGPGVVYTGQTGLTSPFSIAGRQLQIALGKQSISGAQTWVSGIISSVAPDGHGFSQQYGYFETRVYVPANSPGVWPAFWFLPLPGATGAEIDVWEVYGQFPTSYTATLHDWTNSGQVLGSLNLNLWTAGAGSVKVFGAWHTYGMLWTKQTITIYMDGAQLFTMATPAIAQQPMYILLDYGLGGGWPTNQTPNPSYMYVQYVRAWKAPD